MPVLPFSEIKKKEKIREEMSLRLFSSTRMPLKRRSFIASWSREAQRETGFRIFGVHHESSRIRTQ
jgi:hypothetical protein